MQQTGFNQAPLSVQSPELFDQLRGALGRVFAANRVEKFLRRLVGNGVPIRDFDMVLDRQLLESVDDELSRTGKSARSLFDALPVSDQAQIREFYLTALESIEQGLREQYAKLYRYY